ncbi:hypothetical protein [Phytopseudomonas dryadis]|uniref:hypothetical protein n=1 Tax=Pseudomonadaceae TaxID=135621 RepID=UPI0013F177C6|nr:MULTISPECIES: hypothetical protein [Pseudomonas]
MNRTTNVVDLSLFRKRRQARLMAEAMWAMYAARAGYVGVQMQMLQVDKTCQG